MGDYDALDDKLGKMKRAAIDCWMADQSFSPHFADSSYYAKWGFMRHFYKIPDSNGNGGGETDGMMGDSIADQFEQIRQAVDSVVSPWLDLPDGSECEDPQRSVSSTASQLGSDAAAATVQNSGEIATSSETIEEVLISNIRGSFTAPFLDKYYTQFTKVTRGLGDSCVLLETNYAAGAAMWPAARQDVADLCEAARAAWEKKAADSADANATLVLSVVAVVAGVVASIVTAGAGTVAAVAALSTIGATANAAVQKISADAVISGSSYGEILTSLQDGLATLNTALTEQEQALKTMLQEATSTIRGDQASFNLDAFSLGDYPYADGTMSMDSAHASMVSTNMGRIEGALSTASAALGSPLDSSPTPRNSGIGVSSTGTHTQARSLYAVTARCLELTTEEYSRGRNLFDATVADYFETDADAKQTISGLLTDEALTSELGV